MTQEDLFGTALEGIDVEAAGGVVRVRDGHDTWLCREAEWDAMVERVRSGAVRLSGADEDGYCDDYSTICAAVRGPVLTLNGSDHGTLEERRELLRAAVEAELLLETDAARYGLA
jgi:hypothetical protein